MPPLQNTTAGDHYCYVRVTVASQSQILSHPNSARKFIYTVRLVIYMQSFAHCLILLDLQLINFLRACMVSQEGQSFPISIHFQPCVYLNNKELQCHT